MAENDNHDPVAVPITAPVATGTYYASQSIVFKAGYSWPKTPTWTFGDGTSGSGLSTTHTYTAGGTYTAQITYPKYGGHENGDGPRVESVTIKVIGKPSITSFTSTPTLIQIGKPATLKWAVTGTNTALSLEGIGAVTGSSKVVSPSTTTTYTLTATNGAGRVSAACAVTVNLPPVLTPSVTMPQIDAGVALNYILPAASDPDGDAVAYAVTGLPSGVSFDPASRTLSGSCDVPTVYTLRYIATDVRGGQAVSLVKMTISAAGVAPPEGFTATIQYQYDASGRLTRLVYPSGNQVNYTYDALDRVVGAAQNGTAIVQNMTYDSWSNPQNRVSGSGTIDEWAYDVPGTRVTRWSIGMIGGVPESRTYTYDTADRLTQAGEWGTLSYDKNSRLTRATASSLGVDNVLDHDAYNNNIKSASTGALPPSMVKFDFDPMVNNHLPGRDRNDGLTQISETNFGEITNLGTGISSPNALSMTWDDLGRMASTTLNGAKDSYQYAASGLRVSRINSQNANLNRIYAYTGTGSLLSEYTASPTPTWKRDVIYLGSLAVAEIDADGVHELHSDHLGSPRVITGAAGTVEGTQAYGPYGELLQQTGYIPLTGYTGHLQTEPTGLIYMRGRFYSPAWHRFMNSNYGVDPNLLNQFGYTFGSPLMATDPSGYDWSSHYQAMGESALKGEGRYGSRASSGSSFLDNVNRLRDWYKRASKSDWFNKNKLNDLYGSNGFETIATDVTEMSDEQIGSLYAGWHKSLTERASLYNSYIGMGMANVVLRPAAQPLKWDLRVVQNPAIPSKALSTLRTVRTTGNPPPGQVGGRIFKNREGKLPSNGNYREYDVDPKPPAGQTRNAERLVIDDNSGAAYYTNDHYDTFIGIP